MDWSGGVVSYLTGVTVRSMGLMILGGAAIALPRVRTAAARHAVWAVTVAGMLLLAVMVPLMPALPLRVLGETTRIEPTALPEHAAVPAQPTGGLAAPPRASGRDGIGWRPLVAGIYAVGALLLLLRLVLGYVLTVRLMHGGRVVEEPWGCEVLESDRVRVPMTVGWLRPRILMPTSWRQWGGDKLRAVLVHEQTHVERRDWLVAMLAGLNRCVFWFHPGAWWMERQLALLAEQACDDGALLRLGGRREYAQALLDMAAAVKGGEGRLIWEVLAMAKASEVSMRIDRILDENRQIPRGPGRLYWVLLLAGSLPSIWVISAAQLAPAMAQEQTAARGAGGPTAARPDFGQMEQYVAAHPDDLEARSKLIRDYFLYSISQPRLNHIFWMIQNHPESELTALNSTGILPHTTPLMNTADDYQTAAALWRVQVSGHPTDTRVLANAARFFAQSSDRWEEAGRLLVSARSLDGGNFTYERQLARLYATAILGSENTPFTDRVKSELESSTDGILLRDVGSQLAEAARTQPAWDAAGELGKRLVVRAQTFGMRPAPPMRPSQEALAQTAPAPAPTRVRVGGNVQQSKIKTTVKPEYPQAARNAGIEGTVELTVVIGKDGTVRSAEAIDGNPLLAAAAQQAVMQWVYMPTFLNGFPVEVVTTVKIPFTPQ